jgi:hypothetical protein
VLGAFIGTAKTKAEKAVALVTVKALVGVREGIADLAN